MKLGEIMRKTEDVSIQFGQEETVSENINVNKTKQSEVKQNDNFQEIKIYPLWTSTHRDF